MYQKTDKELLSKFASAIAIPIALTDAEKWPVRSGKILGPVRKNFAEEFYNQLNEANVIQDKGNWKKIFKYPTQLWRNSHHIISGLKDLKISETEIAKKLLLLLQGIEVVSKYNDFEIQGKHLILDEKSLNSFDSYRYYPYANDTTNLLKLSGLLWSYSEMNYFVAHDIACEYHGPYIFDENYYIMVRNYSNLCPTELWENFSYENLVGSLDIITIHDKTLDIKFDVYNNLYDETNSLLKSLKTGVALINGSEIPYPLIDILINLYGEKMMSFYAHINSMTPIEIAKKYVDIFWYRKKPLTDYLNISWKPNKNLYDIVEENLNKGSSSASSSSSTSGRPSVEDMKNQYDYSSYIK